MLYKRLCKGLADRGTLISSDADVYENIDVNSDYYVSTYLYNESQKTLFDEHGTVAGITDVVTNRIWWDLDSEHEPELARQDANKLVARLTEKVSPQDIVIAYSGNKGFGVEVNLTPHLTPKEVKAIAFDLASDLPTFDVKMYNASRILRVIATRHQKTGLYKTPLTLNQLNDLSVDNIMKLAKNEPTGSDEFRWQAVPLWTKLESKTETNEKNLAVYEAPSHLDYSMKPKFLTNCRWSIQNGHFKEGDRSTALLCLASTYKNMGFDLEHVYRLLKGTAELQSRIHHCERFPDEEVYNNIVMQVFGPYWNNGQYTCREEDNWLGHYCSNLDQPCNHKAEDDLKPKTFISLAPDFKDYVMNIDKNTIKTGLFTLDKHVFLSTGANVGIIAPPGAGKCLGRDTEVRMYDGSLKKVQNVKVGDLLMGDDSTHRRVLSICKGEEQLYKVRQKFGEDYIVNESHILSLKGSANFNKKKRISKYNTEKKYDVKVSDIIKFNKMEQKYLKGYRNPIEYGEQKTQLSSYFLGYWLGDGTTSKPEITFGQKDSWLMDWFREYASSVNCGISIYQDRQCQRISFNGGPTRNNYIFKNLPKYKHIPKEYLINSRENRLELLAGLIDSDGHLSSKGYYEITQKSEILINNIRDLCWSLGFRANLKKVKKYCFYKGIKRENNYYRLNIFGNELNDIPCHLERKKFTSTPRINYELTPVKIEKLEIGEYFGFEIDNNKRFILKDYTVTHNTSIAFELLENTSLAGVHSVFGGLDMAKNRTFEKLLYRETGLGREELYKIFQNGKEGPIIDAIHTKYKNVHFFKKSAPTVQDFKEYIKQVEDKTGNKVKLVIGDYFERFSSDMGDDTAASKSVAGELQDLVDDLNICNITLYQPHKAALNAGPDQPIYDYTKIKGSSFVYQSLRIILSMWRPFYNPRDFANDKYLQMAILKNDLGELGEFAFNWDGKRGRVTDMDQFQYEEFERALKAKLNDKETEKGLNF